MTYSMMVGKYKLIFSDTHFKDFRKKPTISVYDADTNSETKIASFNSQETFEWFIEAVVEADRKTEPTISKMEQVEDEPQRGCDADCNEDCTECAKEWQDWKDQMWTEAVIASKDEPQTDCSWK